MKLFAAGLVSMLMVSGAAHAQPAGDTTGYVAGVAQSSFGNVTSQSFGAEGGWFLRPGLAVVVELGSVRDTAPDAIGPKAEIIAGALALAQPAAVGYSVRQPVAFLSGGLKFQSAGAAPFHPYVLAAFGAGRVTRDVQFTVGGTDVTDTLATYKVVLGTDLAGSTTKPMITAGGGVIWQPKGSWMFDAGYRFSYIATDTTATNVNRIGVGIGYSF